MRIGAFSIESSLVLLAERLAFPRKLRKEEKMENMLQTHGCCMLDNVKNGIWIAGNSRVDYIEDIFSKMK